MIRDAKESSIQQERTEEKERQERGGETGEGGWGRKKEKRQGGKWEGSEHEALRS